VFSGYALVLGLIFPFVFKYNHKGGKPSEPLLEAV